MTKATYHINHLNKQLELFIGGVYVISDVIVKFIFCCSGTYHMLINVSHNQNILAFVCRITQAATVIS